MDLFPQQDHTLGYRPLETFSICLAVGVQLVSSTCKQNCSELSLMVFDAGLLNDLFQFDIDKFLWTDLSNQIRGDAPLARYGHSLESVGNFLYVLGGLGNTSECMLLVANVLIIYF